MKTGNLTMTLVLIALVAGLSLGIVATQLLIKPEVMTEIKVINQTEIKEVEVEKDFKAYLDNAVEKYLDEVKLDLDRFEEIINVKVSDDFYFVFTEDNSTIGFNVEYRVVDTLDNVRTDKSCDVEIISEDDDEILAVC